MKTIKTTQLSFPVHSLKANSFLKMYGVHKITPFELKQLDRFDIPPGQIIATEDGTVLTNWEEVEQAKRRKYKEIEVLVIIGLDEDDIPQVVSFKNIHKKIRRQSLAQLIVTLRDYLENNPSGKIWKEEVPGGNVIEKVAFLLDYSYGMTSSIMKIYKYNPDLLDKIDRGEMTFTEAEKACRSEKHTDKDENKADLDDTDRKDDSDDYDDNTESETISPKPVKSAPPITWRYAGENRMVPCEPIKCIQITYSSGKTIDLLLDGNEVQGTIFGKQVAQLRYNGGKFLPDDNSEFHCLTSKNDKVGMEIIFWNANDMAA